MPLGTGPSGTVLVFMLHLPSGALHKARWMSKILYAIKIVLLSTQIKESSAEVLARGQLPKLQEFVNFVMYVYCVLCMFLGGFLHHSFCGTIQRPPSHQHATY